MRDFVFGDYINVLGKLFILIGLVVNVFFLLFKNMDKVSLI